MSDHEYIVVGVDNLWSLLDEEIPKYELKMEEQKTYNNISLVSYFAGIIEGMRLVVYKVEDSKGEYGFDLRKHEEEFYQSSKEWETTLERSNIQGSPIEGGVGDGKSEP